MWQLLFPESVRRLKTLGCELWMLLISRVGVVVVGYAWSIRKCYHLSAIRHQLEIKLNFPSLINVHQLRSVTLQGASHLSPSHISMFGLLCWSLLILKAIYLMNLAFLYSWLLPALISSRTWSYQSWGIIQFNSISPTQSNYHDKSSQNWLLYIQLHKTY